jgi:dienelactone hydrolase
MADIALFHSVLGLRPGVLDAARRFTAAGHDVLVVDQYDGEVFDDYDDAMAFSKSLGHAELLARASAATAHLPDGFVVAGFSQGGASAEFIATRRAVGGALLFGGAVSPAWFDDPWPTGVPAQVHTMLEDPWREQEEIDAFAAAVRAAGGDAEVFDYPGGGHLFTDASLPKEYDEAAAELLWERVVAFCARRVR